MYRRTVNNDINYVMIRQKNIYTYKLYTYFMYINIAFSSVANNYNFIAMLFNC